MVVLDGNFAAGCVPGTDYPLNTYISMYARTNSCYNERGSKTNYVRSSIPHRSSAVILKHTYFTHIQAVYAQN